MKADRSGHDECRRSRAVDVDFKASGRTARRPKKGKGLLLALLMVAAFFVSLLAVMPPHEWWRMAGVYGLVSLLTFVLYGLDKRAARRGAWRTAEARLHFFELCGGWPGALLAQRMFRHKTRKVPFLVVFAFAVIANLAALGWLLYADAGEALRHLLGVSQVAGFQAAGLGRCHSLIS